jgi:molecular chaperone GrpE
MSKQRNEQDMRPVDESAGKVIPVNDTESGAAADGGAAPDESSEAAAPEIEQLRARVAELEDQRLRALADMDNYKKRMARQFDEVVRGAKDRLLTELLEVVDNFERARNHVSDDSGGGLREGVDLIYNQLIDLLKRYQVEPIPAVGQVFDPNLHEALLQVASPEHGDGVVAQEIARGYRVGDRVLRYAKVAVSKGVSAESTSADDVTGQE